MKMSEYTDQYDENGLIENPQWRYLECDEIIKDTDLVDMCTDGYNDDPIWVPVKDTNGSRGAGDKAPNPAFPAHTRYMRKMW